jgi:hypothetical protein
VKHLTSPWMIGSSAFHGFSLPPIGAHYPESFREANRSDLAAK